MVSKRNSLIRINILDSLSLQTMGGDLNDEFKSRNLDLKKRVEQMEIIKEDDSDESCER